LIAPQSAHSVWVRSVIGPRQVTWPPQDAQTMLTTR